MSKETDGSEWQITSRKKETHNVYTYTLSPLSNSHRFSFEVGQFVMLGTFLQRPTASGGMEESFVQRAYSISSSPLRQFLEITIKEEKSGTLPLCQTVFVGPMSVMNHPIPYLPTAIPIVSYTATP